MRYLLEILIKGNYRIIVKYMKVINSLSITKDKIIIYSDIISSKYLNKCSL